jgi:hypothetical protein
MDKFDPIDLPSGVPAKTGGNAAAPLSADGPSQPGFPGMAGLNAPEIKAAKGLPPVHLWHPPFCGKIDMAIRRDGSWWYMGTPIAREAMVRLFSTILRKEPDGSYVLVTPVERVEITVEDAPFIAVSVEMTSIESRPSLSFTTNVGDIVAADSDHLIFVQADGQGHPVPYIHVRRGLNARIARPVYYELVDLAVERDGVLGLESAGIFMPLGASA